MHPHGVYSGALPMSLERQMGNCTNLSREFGHVSLLSIIEKSTSFDSMYRHDPFSKKQEYSRGSGHRIFYRLIMAAGLNHILNETALTATLFIPNDLSMLTSAQDIMVMYDPKRRITNFSEARHFLVQEFPYMFKKPTVVLRKIVANHLISKKFGLCTLFQRYTWTSWANEKILRSGIRLISPNHTAAAPELDISKLPNVAGDAIVYAVDRVLFPDLSEFPVLPKFQSMALRPVLRKRSRRSIRFFN